MKSRRNRDFQAKKGEMAGLTGKNVRKAGFENPIVDSQLHAAGFFNLVASLEGHFLEFLCPCFAEAIVSKKTVADIGVQARD